MSTKEYYQLHKEKIKTKSREQYHKNKETIAIREKARREKYKNQGICLNCRKVSALPNITKCFVCNQKDKTPERLARKKQVHRDIKIAAFNAYGGLVCVCCGETHEAFLSIDHINGNGTQHRKEVGDGTRMYYWMRRNNYPVGYQIMCHNCNHGRYLNGGICPHQENKNVKETTA